MRLLRVLLPVYTAVLPVATLLSHNILEVRPGDSLRALALALFFGGAALVAGRVMAGDWKRGSLLAAIGVFVVSSYGHTYAFLKQFQVAGEVIGRHRYLLPAYLILASLGSWWVLRSSSPSQQVLAALSGSLFIALLIPLGNVARVELLSGAGTPAARRESDRAAPTVRDQGELPDVYFIVLDAYGRQDHLETWFGYDNHEFLQALRERGFYVADQSDANYVGTGLSMAATLNMDYLQNLDLDLERGRYPRNITEDLRHSRVRERFESMGYSIVGFKTQYYPTEFADADYYFTPEVTPLERLRVVGRLNSFESILLGNTIARAFLDLQFLRRTEVGAFFQQQIDDPRSNRREVVLAAFEHLESVPAIPEPTFTFAHMITPHQPYIFTRDGSIVSAEELHAYEGNQLGDDNHFYLGQLIHISNVTLDAIDTLLEESETDPIIILQGDHGPNFILDWENPQPDEIRARVGILNALYLPEECRGSLYPSVTPVNTFRIVFNCVYGDDLPLVDDRSFFSNIFHGTGVVEFTPVDEVLGR